MKNERTALIVGIIFLVIVNLFVGIWLFTDESDKPDTQASTAASDESTEGVEFTTEEPMTEEPTTEEPATEEPTTEEPTTEAPEPMSEIEVSFDDIRREVLKVGVGSEEGMVNCGENHGESFGPGSFAVEEGAFYILDTYNSRINIYRNGNISHIKVGNNRTRMKYQDGRFAVSSMIGGAEIAVYEMDGKLVAEKKFESSSKIQGITEILLIGDTYVEFLDDTYYASGARIRYRYDWRENKTEKLGLYKPTQEINEDMVKEHQNGMTVIGKYDQSVYYRYTDQNEDGTIAYNVLNREEGNIRWCAYIDLMSYFSNPLERFYLSTDGGLYTMECFEDRTVISRLFLGEDVPTEEEPVLDYLTQKPTDKVFDSENVIEVDLETNWDTFRIRVKEIRKEDDHYVITGNKIYGGFVILTVEQKLQLDEGAVLKLMYAGEEMERIVRCDEPILLYRAQNSETPFMQGVEEIESEILSTKELEALRTILENAPYYGEGYYLDSELPRMKYNLVLEHDVRWELPADLAIDPECYLSWDNPNATGEWTMERFYEEAIVRDGWNYEKIFEVYTEDGEIVKIYEPFSM